MKNLKIQYPSGDFAIWIIIYIELITFGLFFIGFAFSRKNQVDIFNSSQLLLDQRFGFINTVFLITSSFFVVKAVKIIKAINTKKSFDEASRYIMGAIGLGFLFLVLKIIEFSEKYSAGIHLSTNDFFMFYFILTIFHFMHVVLGMIILYNLFLNTKKGLYTTSQHRGLETGASYWHMVDLLWIVLFPLVYIIR